MERVFEYGDFVIDLGNIKCIKTRSEESYSGYPRNWYIIIELLRGNEFVFNPETELTELVKPVIEIKFSAGNVSPIISDISRAWGRYLESKEEKDGSKLK